MFLAAQSEVLNSCVPKNDIIERYIPKYFTFLKPIKSSSIYIIFFPAISVQNNRIKTNTFKICSNGIFQV